LDWLFDFLNNKKRDISRVSSSTLADWLTAIGTVGAVVVSLAIAFAAFFLKQYDRPKLKIEYDDKNPFCCRIDQLVGASGGKVNRYTIRLRVLNSGRSIATLCEGRLVRIIDVHSMKDLAYRPLNLKWSGYESPVIEINRGAFEYLDLVSANENAHAISVITIDREVTERVPHQYEPFTLEKGKNYLFDVVLYTKDAEPEETRFIVKTRDGLSEFPGLKVSEVPKNKDKFTEEELRF
jgi:hypothetical protein